VHVRIYYDNPRWEEKQIIRAIEGLGAELTHIRVNERPLELSSPARMSGLSFVRCMSHYNALYCAAHSETVGLKTVNTFSAILAAGDKAIATMKLSHGGLPVPEAFLGLSKEAALRVTDSGLLSFPVVVKPVVGSWGRLVSLASDRESLKSIAEHREATGSATMRPMYIQRFVRRPPRDLRVFVVGDRAVAAEYRVSQNGEFRTNVALGGRAEKADITKQVEELSTRAANVFGAGVYGVDLMEDEELGLIVNEVNPVPEFRAVSEVSGTDVAHEIAEFLAGCAR
jgi:[lysine-biosynthesis-protein LysW]--L-2-aminoadipate ligase